MAYAHCLNLWSVEGAIAVPWIVCGPSQNNGLNIDCVAPFRTGLDGVNNIAVLWFAHWPNENR
eukprot:2629769-Lingulodinium_polyedra.AAC.1